MLSSHLRLKVLLVLLLCTATSAATQNVYERIDAYLTKQAGANAVAGLAAAVVQGGEVIYIGAHGVRNVDEDVALTPEHVFHFASVSKPFVATAIVQLVEQGKLDLDQPVVDLLPYFRLSEGRFQDITIRQMLNHTSGMPDVDDYEWDNPEFDEGAAERNVRAMASERLLWAPGHGWRYSNMAFDALGDVIAKASGQSFEGYVQTNIIEPLGMNNSSFIYPDIKAALRTTGHVGDPALPSDVYPYNRRHAPSSTLNSSVSDMTRWLLVNLNGGKLAGRRILRPESHAQLLTPTTEKPANSFPMRRTSHVGLSWFLGEHAGHRTVSHGGGDTGFRSFVLLVPDIGIGIVIASNSEGIRSGDIAHDVLDLLLASNDS